MPYILENPAKTISNLRKLDKQTRNHFQTKLRLENKLFLQKQYVKFFLKLTMPKDLCHYNFDLLY